MTSKCKFLLASMLMGVSLAADAAQIQHGDKISTKRSGKVVPFRSQPTLPKGFRVLEYIAEDWKFYELYQHNVINQRTSIIYNTLLMV